MARTDITKVNPIFPSAFVALGGMLYVLATLAVLQAVAAYLEDGRIVVSSNQVLFFLPLMALSICTAVIWLYAHSPGGKITGLKPFGDGDAALLEKLYLKKPGNGTVIIIFIFICLMGFSLLAVGVDLASFLISTAVSSTVAYFLTRFFDLRVTVRLTVLMIWFIGYVCMGAVGSFSTISLPVFIICWLIYGGLAGNFLTNLIRLQNIEEKRWAEAHDNLLSGKTTSNPQGAKSKARKKAASASVAANVRDINYRRRHTSSKYSEFGRLPQDTANVLAHFVRRTTGPVMAALPIDASRQMVNDTIRIVLDCLILDWRINNNLDGLDDTDVQDLRSFIALACTFADASYDQVSRAIYKATLRFLLQDWLENWNSEGLSGPPGN